MVFLSGLSFGSSTTLKLNPSQKEIYSGFTPERLETFVAESTPKGVAVYKATDAGYYMESRGLVSGSKIVIPSAKKGLLAQVDLTEKLKGGVDAEQGNSAWPAGQKLEKFLQTIADPNMTNASTTTCDKCHNAQNVVRKADGQLSLSAPHEDAYVFHTLRSGVLNLRTIRELQDEVVRASH